MKYYTWKDVERTLYKSKKIWKDEIVDIEVYTSEVVVKLSNGGNWDKARRCLSEVLGRNIESGRLDLDLHGSYMNVTYEESEEIPKDVLVPLFSRVLYRDSAYRDEMLEKELEGRPVIAFHSYKGGLGEPFLCWHLQKRGLQKNKMESF